MKNCRRSATSSWIRTQMTQSSLVYSINNASCSLRRHRWIQTCKRAIMHPESQNKAFKTLNITEYRSYSRHSWASWTQTKCTRSTHQACLLRTRTAPKRYALRLKEAACRRTVNRRICSRLISISIMVSRLMILSRPMASKIVPFSYRKRAKTNRAIKERKHWSNIRI